MSYDPRAIDPTDHGKTPSGKIRYNNDKLYTGSPMYFYCDTCGEESDRKPEDYDPRYSPVKRTCSTCQPREQDESTT